MLRTLLAGTALAGLVATAGFAQDAAAPSAPAAQATPQPSDAVDYVRRLDPDQVLASDLSGVSIYESAAPDARALGEIRNFVVGNDGRLVAVVIETSGLDQRKTVAAPADRVAWTKGGDRLRVVLRALPQELEAAPAFSGRSAAETAGNGAMASGSGATPPNRTGANVMPAPTSTDTNGYLAALADDQRLSQNVIGSNVYSGLGDDASTIGSVNDLVLTPRGQIPVAVVGVGGFLGIGEKNVGVPYRALSIQPGNDSEPRLVMAASKEQLTAAPTFEEGHGGDPASSNGGVGRLPVQVTHGATGADAITAADNGGRVAVPTPDADPAITASTGSANDVSALKPVAGAELTADNLKGVAVYGPNDQAIGKVGDIALTADGRVDAVVVDVGGFLGIGSKPVAVAMENLRFMRDTDGTIDIYTQFTQEQLKNAPEFNRESYARNRDAARLGPAGGAASAAGAPDAGATAPVQ